MKAVEISTFLQYHYISTPRWSPWGNWISYWIQCADLERDTYCEDLIGTVPSCPHGRTLSSGPYLDPAEETRILNMPPKGEGIR